MHKFFCLALACLFSIILKAQTPLLVQPFGKIDKADLELKSCDFEKDANAMVLFDKANVFLTTSYQVITEIHKRIKIFNVNAKEEGDIRLEYFSGGRAQSITGLQAQTINLNNGNIEIIKVDKKQIFTEVVDDDRSALVFSFPNVQPGSVLEFKYTITANSPFDFPDWYFQSNLPNRYSILKTTVPNELYYKNLESRFQPYTIDKEDNSGTHTRAMENIPSIPDEPFMTSREDNCERILFQLLSYTGSSAVYSQNFSATWLKVGEGLMESEYLGTQLGKKLNGEEAIIAKAKTLASNDEKIAFVFGEVKNAMKWNNAYRKSSYDGVYRAWEKKTGNSGELNMIVCHLLKKSGVKVYPMIVSTRGNGKVNPAYPNSYKFNSLVAYVPVDSTRSYVLDASNKYNLYNQVPTNLLNTFGLCLNKDDKAYDMLFLQNTTPVRQVIMVNAEIKPDSKVTGIANVVDFAYKRMNAVERYKTDGEKKYIDYLKDDNSNLKISSIKFENMDIDTLPLKEIVDFNLELTGSDDNYIYFNPNVLGVSKTSPFLKTSRSSDIDFGYSNNYSLIGIYKLPAGFKVESLPKSISMTMPDASISFKRILGEQDGSLSVRYIIERKKSIFFKEDYAEFHEFFKKMYEMLNEPVVLKKS
ncbi:hypothetical protein A0256_07215 [Mucilaginibacter sp. PAMC 26640]|nr:hypothetical protein A0256_07215 [Mucilaginibacter sp. PAMC 26640]